MTTATGSHQTGEDSALSGFVPGAFVHLASSEAVLKSYFET